MKTHELSTEYKRLFTKGDRLEAVVGELHGIASALIYDGKIKVDEIKFLEIWLDLNAEFRMSWPINEIYTLLKNVCEDGKVTPVERQKVFKFLADIATGSAYTPTAENIFTVKPSIEFPNGIFLFTGDLMFGERSKAEAAVSSHGGSCVNSYSPKVNYLVVGDLGSEAWKFKRYGRKIEAAMNAVKDMKATTQIIREHDFVQAILS